ncbi:KfrA protein [Klebsiella pneumoniae]|uniref:DNA-binding protein n=1 Tax=Klebsiella pneumoniae TaxID=573 RepID=UPI0010D2EC46|nr:DNA-binding protein [Klebsiella pneumoniae]VTN79826.1 KfrA protein [Klebsiella pneumoniae]
MAITKQDIWRAADELDAEGIRPTLAAVRKKLGSGSFTTISDAMAEWKNRKTATLPSSDPLPVAVNEHLAELGNALWAIALAHANARFDEDRKQIEADKAAISQQLAEAIELADTFTPRKRPAPRTSESARTYGTRARQAGRPACRSETPQRRRTKPLHGKAHPTR